MTSVLQEAYDNAGMKDWQFVEKKTGLAYLEIITSRNIGAFMAQVYFIKKYLGEPAVWNDIEKMKHGELKEFMNRVMDMKAEEVEVDSPLD